MKNKKILAIGLCGAICLSIAGVTYASALASDTPKVSTSETGNTSGADILYQDTDGGQISVDGKNWVAEADYQRCWFAMFSDDTFLKFLLLWGDLDDFIDLMNGMESSKKEMAEVTADAEDCSAEERDKLQGYINDLQKEIDYYWNKFLERKRQKESYVFEKEIENIMAWKSQLDTILAPKNP